MCLHTQLITLLDYCNFILKNIRMCIIEGPCPLPPIALVVARLAPPALGMGVWLSLFLVPLGV